MEIILIAGAYCVLVMDQALFAKIDTSGLPSCSGLCKLGSGIMTLTP